MSILEMSSQYNDVAEKYAESFLTYNRESIDAYFNLFDSDYTDKKILDVGCGNGYDLSKIKEKNASIYGFDGSEEMVKIAQKRNPSGIVKVGCFDKIPFENNTFDLVVSKWAIQTASEIDPIYKEIIRVSKAGGKLIYLACHPIRQFIEKKKKNKNYFCKEIVESVFFGGQITALEPSHTFNEYFTPFFFSHFNLEFYEEGFDSAAEVIDGDIYPSYFIVKASVKN